MTEGSDYELATTVDQIAAKRIGGETPLPSLELAMDIMTAMGNFLAIVRPQSILQSAKVLHYPVENAGVFLMLSPSLGRSTPTAKKAFEYHAWVRFCRKRRRG